MARAKAPASFPFFFVGHGGPKPARRSDWLDYYLVFERPVPEDEQGAIVAARPAPLQDTHRWVGGGVVLYLWHEHGFGSAAAAAYGGTKLGKAEAAAYSEALDAWLRATHEKQPLAAVVAKTEQPKDPWHRWSVREGLSEALSRLLPRIEERRPKLGDELDAIARARTSGKAILRAYETPAPVEDDLARHLAWVAHHMAVEVMEAREGDGFSEDEKAALEKLLVAARGFDDDLTQRAELLLNRLGRPYPSKRWLDAAKPNG